MYISIMLQVGYFSLDLLLHFIRNVKERFSNNLALIDLKARGFNKSLEGTSLCCHGFKIFNRAIFLSNCNYTDKTQIWWIIVSK